MARKKAKNGKHVKVNRTDLNKAVKLLSRIVSSAKSMPLLQHISMKTEKGFLVMVATDLENRLTLKIECIGSDLSNVLVPIKIFQKLIKGRASDNQIVKLEVTKNKMKTEETTVNEVNESTGEYGPVSKFVDIYIGELSVTVDEITTKIKLDTNPKDFPEPIDKQVTDKKKKWKELFVTNGKLWKGPLDYVRLASSTDKIRYNLNSILVDDKVMVATDGHRLHGVYGKFGVGKDEQLLIGTEAVRTLSELITSKKDNVFTVSKFGDNHVKFEDSSYWKIETRMVDGQFPDYIHIIPDRKELAGGFTAKKEKFLKVLKRMKTLANSRYDSYFIMNEKESTVGIKVDNDGNETVTDIEVDSVKKIKGIDVNVYKRLKEISFGMNLKYIEDAIKFDCDMIRFSMIDDLSPGLFEPLDNDQYFSVVMPIRF